MNSSKVTDPSNDAAKDLVVDLAAVLEALELASSNPDTPLSELEHARQMVEAVLADTSVESLERAVSLLADEFKPENLAAKLLDIANVFRDEHSNTGRAKDFGRLALSAARRIEAENNRQPLLAEAELLMGCCLREEGSFLEAKRALSRAELHARASGDASLVGRVRLAQERLREDWDRPASDDRIAGAKPDPAEVTSVLETVKRELGRGNYDAARRELGRVLPQNLADGYLAKLAKIASTIVTFEIFRENHRPADAVENAELDLWEGQFLTYISPNKAEAQLLSALSVFRSARRDFDAALSCLSLVILCLHQERVSDASLHLETLVELSLLEGLPPEKGRVLQEFCGSAAEKGLDLTAAQAVRQRISPIKAGEVR